MKVKVITRSEEACTRERAQDVIKVHRNLDPTLHPMEKAKEYTRALNAVKLQRVFARPFVSSMAHDDGVTCLARNPARLGTVLSGCADGVVRVWDVASTRCLRRLEGHSGAVRGLGVTPDGSLAVSAGVDATLKLWRVPFAPLAAGPVTKGDIPIAEWTGVRAFRDVSHHFTRPMFASAGVAVEVWDHERSHSVQSMPWGSDGVTSVRFNPAEAELLAAGTSDRGVALYDLRTGTALRKLVMQTKANRVSWNPQVPFTFVVASDDACLYTYDMRRLAAAKCVHEDFVSAVTDVDFSPTGREFVAGGYDRTLRIFASDGGHSRDVYHTKRQQRVAAVAFSGDGSYVFSGSDDMNLRVWKAEASAPQGIVMPRQRRQLDYAAALVERHKHLPEVRRIHRARHLPKAVLRAQQLRRVQIDAEAKKTRNRVAQSGGKKPKPARQRKIVAELE